MTGMRRLATVVGLTVGVILTATVPASAAFADSTPAIPHRMDTLTVTAPASVSPTGYCSTTTSGYTDATTGAWITTYSYWYNATVTWPASTTARGVTGYLVMAHLNNGQTVPMAQTDAVTRSVSATVDRGYLAYQPTISVITLTSYGWTAETARAAVPTC